MLLTQQTQQTTCTPVLTAGMRCKRLQKKPCRNPFSEMYVLLLTGGEDPRVLKTNSHGAKEILIFANFISDISFKN